MPSVVPSCGDTGDVVCLADDDGPDWATLSSEATGMLVRGRSPCAALLDSGGRGLMPAGAAGALGAGGDGAGACPREKCRVMWVQEMAIQLGQRGAVFVAV